MIRVEYSLNAAYYQDFLTNVVERLDPDRKDSGISFYVNGKLQKQEISIVVFTELNLATKYLEEWSLKNQTWVTTKIQKQQTEVVYVYEKGECRLSAEPYLSIVECPNCNTELMIMYDYNDVPDIQECTECGTSVLC